MTELTVVPMTEEYLTVVAGMEQACFAVPWTQADLRAELDSKTAVFRVVLAGDTPAGYGGMHFVCGEGYIDNIAVLPAFRRHRVGDTVVAALLDYAQSHGGTFVTLEVRESNAPARALYAGLGFQPVGRRRGFYTKPNEDALLLTCTFPKST